MLFHTQRDRDSKATGQSAATTFKCDWAKQPLRGGAGCQTPGAIHWGTHIRISHAASCGHPTPQPVSDESSIHVRTSTRTNYYCGALGTVDAERQDVCWSA